MCTTKHPEIKVVGKPTHGEPRDYEASINPTILFLEDICIQHCDEFLLLMYKQKPLLQSTSHFI